MPEIHIEIQIAGDGFPTDAEFAKRCELEDALASAEVGTVVVAGGGVGVMDLYMKVRNVPTAISQARLIIERLGLAGCTTIAPVPGRWHRLLRLLRR